MQHQHHAIAVQKTAHYYTLGTPGPHIRQFWIVCHGYAQLADEFLQQLTDLDNEYSFVVAPEALHYFYRKGFHGPVGANWMTRHHREAAMADYINYLQQLYDFYRPQLPADVRIVVLGFSQGVATVCRWVTARQPDFQDLLLWGGMPPEDIDYAQCADYLKTKNLYLLYGSEDPFITPDNMAEWQAFEASNGLDFTEQQFEGGHEIPPEALRSFIAAHKN